MSPSPRTREYIQHRDSVHQDHRRKVLRGVSSLGVGDTETVGPINFDIANDQTAISARIWVPEGRTQTRSIIARMEVGDSIFGGAVDINWVHAEAELTQAGWNDVVFDFSQPGRAVGHVLRQERVCHPE